MVSSTLLLFGLASIFLYVTPCVSDVDFDVYFGQLRIINKRKPFQVVLGNSKNNMLFCGGTLITDYYVLTAAECVVNRHPHEIEVFTAIKYLSTRYSRCKLRSVDEIIIHDLYDPRDSWRNNIALLKLVQVFLSYNCVPWVNKAIVPQEDELNNILQQKRLLKISGFGITSENKEPKSDEMVESYIYITDWEHCREIYRTTMYEISNKLICANGLSEIIINSEEYRINDVGSPLIIHQNVILGIALSEKETIYSDFLHFPMLFTNVSCYRDWIQHEISRYDEDDFNTTILE